MTDFGEVKNKIDNKTPLRETGCLSIFWPPPGITGTPCWLLRSVKVSTSSELYPSRKLLFFIIYLFFWMLRHPIFWFTSLFLTQSVRVPLVTYPSLCCAYVSYGTPWHAIGHQALPPNSLPRKAEDLPRGGYHSKHMPLLTYLAWLEPIYYDPKLVFKLAKTEKKWLVVETLIKNIEQQPH